MDCPQDIPWIFRRLSHGLSVDSPWDKGLCLRFGLVDDGLIYEGVTGQRFHIAMERGPRHVLAKEGLRRQMLFALLHAAPSFPSAWSPALSTIRPT